MFLLGVSIGAVLMLILCALVVYCVVNIKADTSQQPGHTTSRYAAYYTKAK